jgi:tetratricopeptide (TPR) repeat protein/predicted aspartyl protease
MLRGTTAIGASGILAATLVIHAADARTSSRAADIQLQLAQLLFEDGRYGESLDAYQRALDIDDPARARLARIGVVQSALRVAEFSVARRQAEKLLVDGSSSPEVLSLYGDSLWASGLFDEAESKYRDALALTPENPRGRHGLARALLARSQLDQALDEAQAALKLAPRDLEIHHTVGTIYERMHKYEEAAAAFSNYVNLLPNKDHSDKAAWSRAEIRFLRSFGQKVPFDMDAGVGEMLHTVPFRLVGGNGRGDGPKVIVRAKVNDGAAQDFVVDTGSENTVLSRRTAERVGVAPITYTLSAGVGRIGLRGLQLARIDSLEIGTLKLRNVPCLIKNPPLRDIPVRESESFSPLALGFSMTIDYKRRELTIGRHLPPEPATFELPLRVYRLATVRGVVDRAYQADFVIDTGGEVISISHATAVALGRPETGRRIALKVYGTSGWDPDAFLMPGVDLAFDAIQYKNFPVVVLNLDAPSALLGFELGGIVGHKFLSRYRVGVDLDRSVLRLKEVS